MVVACVEAVLARASRLDMLANNIGAGIGEAAEETELGEAMQVLAARLLRRSRLPLLDDLAQARRFGFQDCDGLGEKIEDRRSLGRAVLRDQPGYVAPKWFIELRERALALGIEDQFQNDASGCSRCFEFLPRRKARRAAQILREDDPV